MHAMNVTAMRQINRKLILDQIRRQPISRTELAQETLLTRASVTQIIDELIEEGLVQEGTVSARTGMGRRSTQLSIDPAAGIMFGVNLRRAECAVGAIDMHGKVLMHNAELVSGRNPEELLDAVAKVIAHQTEVLEVPDNRVRGVGFCAFAGVDVQHGVIVRSKGLEQWHDLPVAGMLEMRINRPVCIQNGANSLALDQYYFGEKKNSFILICIEDSVSAGVIVDGKLYPGHMAPGRFCIDAEDWEGRMEDRASIPALLCGTGYRSWVELLGFGRPETVAAVQEKLVKYLSMMIVGMACAFGMDQIVLAGEFTLGADAWLDELHTAVRRRLGIDLNIRLATGVNPVRTAAAAVYDKFFRPTLED